MRCIDADALKEKAWDAKTQCGYVQVVDVGDIDDAPTIEPERKVGTWILIRIEENGNGLYECSECHRGEVHVPIVEVKYCWNCGTKMEGGEQE